jgi:hypothetical protein
MEMLGGPAAGARGYGVVMMLVKKETHTPTQASSHAHKHHQQQPLTDSKIAKFQPISPQPPLFCGSCRDPLPLLHSKKF